eukprot:TRINITY_DN23538_c0_g1_i1.p1 TRINITY_DN23538_c0_g1~~TRINITY_DN23538_c0_g1_i1.p1  ORF type:complete len:224 (+),score=59.15 TRINITY_DN23538_c0_g1_i1:60-731(+)
MLPRGLGRGLGRALTAQRQHVHTGQSKRQRLMMGYGLDNDFMDHKLEDDWEFLDGTPSPLTARKNWVERNLRAYTEMIIESCATIEEMAEQNQLPMRPGTDAIRAFDPKCELYLPVNEVIMDQATSPEQKYEIYGDRAPYYSGEHHPAVQDDKGDRVSGDGSPLETASGSTADVAAERTQKKRRKKVVNIKQHWRHRQPYGAEHSPMDGRSQTHFVPGLGTAT